MYQLNCNTCLDDMRLFQHNQCQNNLNVRWTLFDLVYQNFIRENTRVALEYLPVNSTLYALGDIPILSTNYASWLFVYICWFEGCVTACVEHWGQLVLLPCWDCALIARLDGKHLYSWNYLSNPVVQVCFPLSSHDKLRSRIASAIQTHGQTRPSK